MMKRFLTWPELSEALAVECEPRGWPLPTKQRLQRLRTVGQLPKVKTKRTPGRRGSFTLFPIETVAAFVTANEAAIASPNLRSWDRVKRTIAADALTTWFEGTDETFPRAALALGFVVAQEVLDSHPGAKMIRTLIGLPLTVTVRDDDKDLTMFDARLDDLERIAGGAEEFITALAFRNEDGTTPPIPDHDDRIVSLANAFGFSTTNLDEIRAAQWDVWENPAACIARCSNSDFLTARTTLKVMMELANDLVDQSQFLDDLENNYRLPARHPISELGQTARLAVMFRDMTQSPNPSVRFGFLSNILLACAMTSPLLDGVNKYLAGLRKRVNEVQSFASLPKALMVIHLAQFRRRKNSSALARRPT